MTHATGADFDRFDTMRGDLGPHFGSLQQAVHVVRRRDPVWTQPRILRVRLSIVRPLQLRDEGSFHADGIAIQLTKKGLLPMRQACEITNACDKDFRQRKVYDPQLRSLITSAGFDAVAYTNRHEGFGRSFIVFDADHIRIESALQGPALRALVFEGRKVHASEWLPWVHTTNKEVSAEEASQDVSSVDPCCDCKQFPRFRG